MPRRKYNKNKEYRSGAELVTANWLDLHGIQYEYEKHVLPYLSSVTKGICNNCDSSDVKQQRTYTPDFYFPKFDFFIEVKGRLDSATRKKMRDVKKANPSRDIRFLLMADNKITPKKPERYSDWCKKFGYLYCIRVPPEEWFSEELNCK